MLQGARWGRRHHRQSDTRKTPYRSTAFGGVCLHCLQVNRSQISFNLYIGVVWLLSLNGMHVFFFIKIVFTAPNNTWITLMYPYVQNIHKKIAQIQEVCCCFVFVVLFVCCFFSVLLDVIEDYSSKTDIKNQCVLLKMQIKVHSILSRVFLRLLCIVIVYNVIMMMIKEYGSGDVWYLELT